MPDAATVAAGALVFGQFLSERPSSIALALFGLTMWALFYGYVLVLSKRGLTVAGIYIMLGGMALFAGIITLLDCIGRRQERKARERHP